MGKIAKNTIISMFYMEFLNVKGYFKINLCINIHYIIIGIFLVYQYLYKKI